MWDPPPDRRLTARRAARLATEMQAAPVQLIFLPGASERPGSPVLSSGGALRPKAKSQEGYSLGESSSHASGLARPWKSSSTVHRGEDTERDSDARLAGGLAGTPSELITAGWKLQHARCGWDPAASALAQPQPRRARSRALCRAVLPASILSQPVETGLVSGEDREVGEQTPACPCTQ